MQNKGTLIASEIKSFNTEDDFPYADTSKLKGGHMQVDTIAERDAISMLRRRELMRVSVAENLVTYVLKKDENGELKKWEETDFPIQVKDLSLSTAATLTEGTIAYYAIGKEYFKQIFRYFIVRTIAGRKKFLPIGLTYIIANEGGICIFDPDTEQYILQKTWESMQAPSTYIHPNSHPAAIIDQNELFRFVSDSQIEYWNKKANVDDLNKIISDLVGSAPGSLDTLKELAAALGDDPNFATTIINKLAGKANTDHDHAWESIGNRPSKLSQFANDLGNFGNFLTGINEAMIAAALGYTPYSASNPANFASIEFVKQKISELVSSSPEALDTLKELSAAIGNDPNFATTVVNLIAGKANAEHAHTWESIGNRPSKLSQFANDLGNFGNFLTGINQAMITAALGYTPYNASNPADFATSEYVRQKIADLVASSPSALDTLKELAAAIGNDPNFATTVVNLIAGKANTEHAHIWESIGNRPSKLSQFANDLGNFGNFLTGINQAMVTAALGYTPYNASNPDNFATMEYVRQKIADKIAELVASSPSALDTLNELARAIGNDPNFAMNIINMLAGKASINHNHDDIYALKSNSIPFLGSALIESSRGTILYKKGIIKGSGTWGSDGIRIDHSLNSDQYMVHITLEAESTGADFYGYPVGYTKESNFFIIQSEAFVRYPGCKANILMYPC